MFDLHSSEDCHTLSGSYSRSTYWTGHMVFWMMFWKSLHMSNHLTSKIRAAIVLDHWPFAFYFWLGAATLAIILVGTRQLDTMGRRPAKCYRYNKKLSLEGLWIVAQGFARVFIRTQMSLWSRDAYWMEPNFHSMFEALDGSWISNHLRSLIYI